MGASWILVPWLGIKLVLPHWRHRVLTTGPPGKMTPGRGNQYSLLSSCRYHGNTWHVGRGNSTHGSGKSCWNSGTELGLIQSRIFLGGLHVWMWELDYKESWEPKNWCFWTVMLEKSLESPLDCKEIKPVNPKGNQSWILIGRTNAEAEDPILGCLMQRTDSLEKTLLLG